MHFKFRVRTHSVTALKGSSRLIKRVLSVVKADAKYDISYQKGLWDGREHFYVSGTQSFPRGLFPRLLKYLDKKGHTYEIEDKSRDYEFTPCEQDCLAGFDLRDYQVSSVDEALRVRWCMLWLATNAGKTGVTAAIALKLQQEANLRTLVIVPNLNLLNQTAKNIHKLLDGIYTVGRLGDGRREIDADIVVCTLQTIRFALPVQYKWEKGKKLIKRKHEPALKKLLLKVGCIILDEAHHAKSETFQQISKISKAPFRIGMTGTVKREDPVDQMKLYCYLGPVVQRVSNAELVKRGISAKPYIYYINDPHAFGRRVASTLFDDKGKPIQERNKYKRIVDSALIRSKTYCKNVARVCSYLIEQEIPPFVFSHRKPLLRAIQSQLKALGVESIVLTGDDSIPRRERALARYIDDGDMAILTSPIFDEGADVPQIMSIVYAGGGKASASAFLQRLGRGLRKKEGENRLVVVDFAHSHCELLHKHADGRLTAYKKEGFPVTIIRSMTELSKIQF